VSTKEAVWIGTQLSIASVRSGYEVLGTVESVAPTALILASEPKAFDDEAFRVGDNLRVGWADENRWQHGVAMLVSVDIDSGNYTISLPEHTEAPADRRSTSRIEAFYAMRALIAREGKLEGVNGRSFEVSIGGFSARFAETLPEGVPFAVAIVLGDEVISAVASISRYSDRYAHAVFEQLRERDRERLGAALGLRAIGG
jgi:hypothetical protein